MKRETNQDEFRQTIAPPIEGEKERAKAAMILSTVYANHTGGKSIPSSKNAFQTEKADRFSPLVTLLVSDGKRRNNQASKGPFPKNEKLLILGNWI